MIDEFLVSSGWKLLIPEDLHLYKATLGRCLERGRLQDQLLGLRRYLTGLRRHIRLEVLGCAVFLCEGAQLSELLAVVEHVCVRELLACGHAHPLLIFLLPLPCHSRRGQ